MKKLVTLIMVVCLLFSLTACGNKDSEGTGTGSDVNGGEGAVENQGGDSGDVKPVPVELKVWVPGNQVETGTIDSMAESFQALHPEWDINFTIETQDEDTAKDEILKDIAVAGDIFFYANDQLAELVKAGAVARLGGSTAEMVKATMAPSVVDTVSIGDAIYGIPFTHNTYFMFYDKTLLNSDDIKSVESIMAKETSDNVYNFCFDQGGGWMLAAWYYGAGLTIYGESQVDFEKGCNWNNETGVAVTNYLIDLIHNPKTAFKEDVSISELAADHRIGAWFDGPWNYQIYKDALGDDLGIAIIPTFNPDGNDYQLKSFYGSKAISVNSHTAHPDVAVAFAAYLGGEEMQALRFEETAQVPTNLTVGESSAVQENEIAAVMVDEVNNASVMQPISAEFNSRYWSNVGAIAPEIKNGDLNKDNVQEKLDTFVETMVVE